MGVTSTLAGAGPTVKITGAGFRMGTETNDNRHRRNRHFRVSQRATTEVSALDTAREKRHIRCNHHIFQGDNYDYWLREGIHR